MKNHLKYLWILLPILLIAAMPARWNPSQFMAQGGYLSHTNGGNLGTNMTVFASFVTTNVSTGLYVSLAPDGGLPITVFNSGNDVFHVSQDGDIAGETIALNGGLFEVNTSGDVTTQGGASIVSFLSIPADAAPTTDAFGEIAGDNNAWAASRGALQIFDGTANTYAVATLASDTPANGEVPVWNTGGTVTWEQRARALNFQSTSTGNVGAGEDTIFTYTIQASTLAVNGQAIAFDTAGTFAGTGNNKRIRVKFGATTIFDTGAGAAYNGEDWRIFGKIYRTGAATQKATINAETMSTTTGIPYTDYTTPTETLSGTVVLTITAEATSDNDVVGEIWSVKFEPAP